jgi:Domain of unknown function (DUF4333)
MQLPGRSESVMRQGRPAATSPGRAGSAVLAAILAASLVVSACGGSTIRSKSPTILNTEKIERAIERSALAQRSEHAIVSCPSGVHQKQGVTFSCTATVGRSSTRFVVNQVDGSGDVHYAAH